MTLFHKQPDGSVTVERWSPSIAASVEFLVQHEDCAELRIRVEDRERCLRIEVSNAWAVYRPTHRDESERWHFKLVEGAVCP